MIDIAGRIVGSEHPCFVIAEAGVNHNGSIKMALQMVDVAVHSGADAIKFQTFKSDRLVTRDAPKAEYQTKTTDVGESQLDMLSRLELTSRDHHALMTHCQKKDIIFMSTPFDEESADMLIGLDVPVLKIPSGEITNLPYIEHVASAKRPLIVSTGMSYLSEVEAAVKAIRDVGNEAFVLLHCTSNYPADVSDVNLRAMHTMAVEFGKPVGYSDHTMGIEVALAAVSLGACVIEKHFTLDRSLLGPDHKMSLEPAELSCFISGIRTVEVALGDGRKEPVEREAEIAAVVRKSIVASRDIQIGSVLSEDMLAFKRPGTGLKPDMQTLLIGRTTCTSITAGTIIMLDMVS